MRSRAERAPAACISPASFMKRLLILFSALILSGCASVTVSHLDSSKYIEARRGDVITTGDLSHQTDESLFILGYDTPDCTSDLDKCIHLVQTEGGLTREQRQSALSEIWLLKAFRLHDSLKRSNASNEAEYRKLANRAIDAYLQSARAAYLYLFYSNRTINMRALEDRQTQVRDYYNLSAQNSVAILYDRYKDMDPESPEMQENSEQIEDWTLYSDVRYYPMLSDKDLQILNITADSTVSFKGIRNEYVRDGLGARTILTLGSISKRKRQAAPEKHPEEPQLPWERMPYAPATVLLHFPGKTYKEVEETKKAILAPYDIDSGIGVSINKIQVPLATNYSGAYGLWLANSNFASQSLGTVFGRGDVLERPRVFLMQPYRPDRKTIVLVHGLASSPEAWVNTANEIMGDEELRDHYQIWQVYYPTSWPISVNRKEIAKALEATFRHYDKTGRDPAGRDVVLIGHSMGGIISRLLVSSSGNVIWDDYVKRYQPDAARQKEVREKLSDIFFFEPMKRVNRAVFLAAPHRGTPYADKTLPRILMSMVKLPGAMLSAVTNTVRIMAGKDVPFNPDTMTGVGNLSDKNPDIQALAKCEISPKVKYYSIIGDETDGPIEDSTDGIVPYWSSHLPGAERELIIPSGHSVQETPKAILEIRAILKEHLLALKIGKKAR